VQKEMYAFKDAGNRELALRPEGTPGVIRAYMENSMHQSGANTKLYYMGNMFRAERPQAGRFREFEQVGAEYIGNPHPAADAESITMLAAIVKSAGVRDFSVEINTLGCNTCRLKYRESLLTHLWQHGGNLCKNCRERIERNPLRVLDCKADGPGLSAEAPKMELCSGCAAHFEKVQELLLMASCAFKFNPHLVRGLDYYTRTVFEIKSSVLGSQDALAAGGRYDGLVRSIGDGPDVPAVGWALGVDRTLQAALPEAGSAAETGIFVISACPAADSAAFRILDAFRQAGLAADGGFFSQSLKSQMRSADRSGATLAVMIGEEELKTSSCTLKNLKTGEQKNVPLNAVVEEAKRETPAK
ncbi:MAG: histidine--tRNA ligase, partial [bacterium]